jgi:hypothetical protein
MNPYLDATARGYVRQFLGRFFDDTQPRTLVFGINPGRFGSGLTGVTFTDPIALTDSLGIATDLRRRHELSSIFIYKVIDHLGGPAEFYRRFFLSALSPLGFTRRDVNLNYYDVPALARSVTPFIVDSVRRHIGFGGASTHAVILGRGENLAFFERLNREHGFFREITALEHPRWVMQYRRRHLDTYIAKYAEVLGMTDQRRAVSTSTGRSARHTFSATIRSPSTFGCTPSP